jgi:hypothetical protein
VKVVERVGVSFRSTAIALAATASLAVGCTSSAGEHVAHAPALNAARVGSHGSLAWARTCVPPLYGPVTHDFDGLSVRAARAHAHGVGMTMDFLAADGSCDIGQIPITAGHTYVNAAIANGRIVFARVSEPHTSR